MPRYEVNAPDGQRFEVDAPEGATLEDAFAYVQSNLWTPLDVQAKKKRTWGEAATDIGGSLVKGVGQLAQLPGQVAGLVTGDIDPTTGLQGAGQKLEAYGEELKSPTLKAKEQLRGQKIAQADGMLSEFGTAIKETIKDPALVTSFFAEQVPNLFGAGAGGALTKAGVKLAMRQATEAALGKAGVRGAVGTGAVMQGADIGTDTFDTTFKGLVDGGMPAIQAQKIALDKARVAAIEAAGISLGTAFLPGGTTIERALVGKGMPGVGGFAKGMAGEALSEGVEEGGGAFAKNVGVQEALPETSLTKGVGAAAGLGALGGALFGGPTGAITGMREADRVAAIDAIKAQHESVVLAEAEARSNEEQARRDAYAAEQAATEMRIMKERLGDQFTQSQAFADLSAQVETAQAKAQAAADKIRVARDKVDAGKAQLSMFAEAQPDLFGMVYPKIQEQVAAEAQAKAKQEAQGQLELPLEAQASLGLEAPVQPVQLPTEEKPLAPTGRPVTEADFKAMGVGSTNKKLREQILGKDLADPAQAQEVKDVLENYASGDRSEKIIQGVTKFIDGIKTPQEQLGLGLRRPYGSMKKPVPVTEAPIQEELSNVGKPVEAVAGAIEPSIPEPVVRRRTTPAKAVGEVAGRGVVPTGGIAGLPAGREGTVPSALEAPVAEVPAPKAKAKAKPKKAPLVINPFGQLVEAVAPKSKANLTEEEATPAKQEQSVDDLLARVLAGVETSEVTEEELSGKVKKAKKAKEPATGEITGTKLQQNAEFAKRMGYVTSVGGHRLKGAVNKKMLTAAEAGDIKGVLDALSNSKSPVYRKIAEIAKTIKGLKVAVDETKIEKTFSKFKQGVDTAKITIANIDALREAKRRVDAGQEVHKAVEGIIQYPKGLTPDVKFDQTLSSSLFSNKALFDKDAF